MNLYKNSILLIAIIWMAAANGASAASACKDAGSPTAKSIAFSGRDNDTLLGLSVGLRFGLDPPTFPSQQVATVVSPCKRGEFNAGSVAYSLYGVGELPPRWAISSVAGPIAYIAELPRPAPALASYQAQANATSVQFKNGDMMFVLAITDGQLRQLFRFYDSIPDDSTLTADMCAALSGDWKPLATYDTASGQSSFEGLIAGNVPVIPDSCRAKVR